MKSTILEDYKGQSGTGQPITTENLGASKQHTLDPPSQFDLMRNCAEVYCFEDILVLVLDSFLGLRDLQSMSRVNTFYNKVVPEISRLLLMDWKPLLKPRLGYENKVDVDMNRVDTVTSLALR